MKVLDAKFMQDFIQMCEDGNAMGWHEKNGGNLSYRIKDDEINSIAENFNKNSEYKPIGTSVPKLAGEYFLFTGSLKYFKNVKKDPEDSLAIIEIDSSGDNYRIVWGLVNGGRPTSELPTHLMNHEVKKIATDGAYRVIYHSHPANIIALTFVLPLDEKIFTRELWEMVTECSIVFPEGVGVVEWMLPGGRDIAVATSEIMKRANVAVWAHHGLFCAAEDFDLAFGLMHTVEKSAEILVKVLSMRPDKLSTITIEHFKEIEKGFNLKLDEKYLYNK